MRVNTKVVIDMVTGEVLEHAWYEYSGPVAECKGDSTAQAAEQQQAAFSAQLANVFQKQFAQQSDVLNFLKGALEPQITNPTGYSDQALAAMRTSATQNISSQYDNAQRALQNQNFINGSRDLPSGVQDMQMGALKQGEASDTASAQNTITLNNENLKQSNYWNAIGALSGGVASQYNPLGYAGASTGAANSVAGLSEAYKNSQSSQLLGALGGVAGGAGAAFGGWLGKH